MLTDNFWLVCLRYNFDSTFEKKIVGKLKPAGFEFLPRKTDCFD